MSDTNISDEAVQNATGRVWEEWFEVLDNWGAADKGHKVTAKHLADKHGLTGWWSQMVTVQYERERGLREVGETTRGYQMGAQKTFLPDPKAAWEFITSPEALEIWLGAGAPSELEEGRTYELEDGTCGEIRVVTEHSHVRLTWHPDGWAEATTLQVRANESSSGRGTVAFHHENLPDADKRDQMKKHWRNVLKVLASRA